MWTNLEKTVDFLLHTNFLEVCLLFWKLCLSSCCKSVRVHPSGVTADTTHWWLTTVLHPWQPNWSASVPVTESNHDQPSSQSGASLSPAVLLLFLSDPKCEPTPFTHGQHTPSRWPKSKPHSSQTCSASPFFLSACSIITAGPPLIQAPPIGNRLLATWPTFPIANC